MADRPDNSHLQPSLLDRLSHGDPGDSHAQNPGQSLRELKQCIRRDLENLLNTRWRCIGPPEDFDELGRSLANYGIPDYSGTSLGAPARREEFVRMIARVIEEFEPRLRGVRVQVIGDDRPLDRVLRFRITATLSVRPISQPVEFTSSLEPLTAGIEVKGAA